jgi:hypothetical protein
VLVLAQQRFADRIGPASSNWPIQIAAAFLQGMYHHPFIPGQKCLYDIEK